MTSEELTTLGAVVDGLLAQCNAVTSEREQVAKDLIRLGHVEAHLRSRAERLLCAAQELQAVISAEHRCVGQLEELHHEPDR